MQQIGRLRRRSKGIRATTIISNLASEWIANRNPRRLRKVSATLSIRSDDAVEGLRQAVKGLLRVDKEEGLILPDRSADRSAKLVPVQCLVARANPAGGMKKQFLASSALLRRNSYTVPWNWLVPLFSVAFTMVGL